MKKLSVILLLLSFVLSSCQTTDVYNLPPEKFIENEGLIEDGKITEITLKEYVIKTDEFKVTYQQEYKNTPACLNLIKYDTTFIESKNEKRYRINADTTKIMMSNVVNIKTKLTHTDYKETTYWLIGAAVLTVSIFFIEALLSFRIDSHR